MLNMMGGCTIGMGLVGLAGLVPLAGLAVGLVYLARGSGGGGRTVTTGAGGDEDRALTLLRERYACGAIDHAEYERRRAILGDREWPR